MLCTLGTASHALLHLAEYSYRIDQYLLFDQGHFPTFIADDNSLVGLGLRVEHHISQKVT